MSAGAGGDEYRRIRQGRKLLNQIRNDFPNPALEDAYFENLSAMMETKPRRNTPGQLVLGVGSGRCGSTTLTQLLATAPESCATHENPPLITWRPTAREVGFHIRRFDVLRYYFAVVFDAAHWWLNVASSLRDIYPDLKVVGLVRNTESCVASFCKVPISPTRHVANWREIGIAPDQDSRWSRTYPTYSVRGETKDLQPSLIRKYVEDYNIALDALHRKAPEWVAVVRTEDLGSPKTQGDILRFAGCEGQVVSRAFNIGTTADGASDVLTF